MKKRRALVLLLPSLPPFPYLLLYRIRSRPPPPSSDLSPKNTAPISDHLRCARHHYPLALHLLPCLPLAIPPSTSTSSSPSFLTISRSPLLLPTETSVPLPQPPLWRPPSSTRQLPLPLQHRPIWQLDPSDASRQLVSMLTPDPSPLSSLLTLFSLSLLLLLSSTAFQPPPPAASLIGSDSPPPQEPHQATLLGAILANLGFQELAMAVPALVSSASATAFSGPDSHLQAQLPGSKNPLRSQTPPPATPHHHRIPSPLPLSPHKTMESPWVGTGKMRKVK